MIAFDSVNISFALAGGIIGWVQAREKPQDQAVGCIIRSVFAGAAIPTGILLLAAAYDPKLLTEIKDIGVNLIASGLATLYLAYAEFAKDA